MIEFYAVFAIAAVSAIAVATILAGVVARAGFPLPQADSRFGCVDGLRGYLALSVMVHHAFLWIQADRLGGVWRAPSVAFLNQLALGAVGLFFMTTGFVFYPRILGGFAAASWPAILITRIFRIIPLTVASVMIVASIIMARTGTLPDRDSIASAGRWMVGWDQPPLLGYPDSGRLNAYVLWSLWYEWLFYLLVLPVSAALVDGAKRLGLRTWIVPAALLTIGSGTRSVMSDAKLPLGIVQFLPLFATGMLAFEFQMRPGVREMLRRRGFGVPAGLALLVGMLATRTPYWYSVPLFGFFFICVACGNDLGGALRTQGALVLGECSFGVYLLHGIVLDILFVDFAGYTTNPPSPVLPGLLPVAATITVPIACLAYLLVERLGISIGKSLADRWLGRKTRLARTELEIAP